MDGKGEYWWETGNRYEGDFKNDQLTGKGLYQWTNGDSYEGDLVNGIQNGHGKYIYKTGTVNEGFFLNGKYLNDAEYTEYRHKTDPVFAKQYDLDQYRKAFNSAYGSSDINAFIAKYGSNDLEGLVSKAKANLKIAIKREAAEAKERALQEYRDSYANSKNSYDYNQFILTYKKNDPEKLVIKAKTAKTAALKNEKENYESISRRSWSPNYKVKVTFKTSPGKAIAQLQKVVSAMKVRDPGGFLNPYWVPTFHASAAYDDKGVVIGEWYTSYYEGLSDWSRYLQREMKKLDNVEWNVAVLGETSRPRSNYGIPTPSPVQETRPATSSSVGASYKCDNNGGPGDSRLLAVCADGHKYNIFCWTSGAYAGQCDTQAFMGKYSYSYVIENTCKNRGGLTCLEKR